MIINLKNVIFQELLLEKEDFSRNLNKFISTPSCGSIWSFEYHQSVVFNAVKSNEEQKKKILI